MGVNLIGYKGALFDSNIIIDYLRSTFLAGDTYDQFEYDRAISIITVIEVLSGPQQSEEIARGVLSRFEVLPLNNDIADLAAEIRRQRKLKLPDAVILATARLHQRLLVTRNTKDFDPDDPGVYVPYTL